MLKDLQNYAPTVYMNREQVLQKLENALAYLAKSRDGVTWVETWREKFPIYNAIHEIDREARKARQRLARDMYAAVPIDFLQKGIK